MSQIKKPNEAVTLPFFKNGVTLQFFTVDLQTAGSALLQTAVSTYDAAAYRSPVVVALEAIQARVSVEVIGSPKTGNAANSAFVIGVAAIGGAYPSDNYDGAHPSNNETMAAYLQALVQAAGVHQTIDLGNATVQAYTF